jgi:hypothetical protein
MPASNVLPKVCLSFLFLLIGPLAIGWRAGLTAHGRRFVRVIICLALLAVVPGATMILRATAGGSSDSTPPGNDFAFRGGLQPVEGGMLVAAAVLLTIVACGAALAQTWAERRRHWLTILLFASATPLVLSVTFFTLNLLRVEPHGAFLLPSGLTGAFATLGVTVYAGFGIGWRRPREIARPS